MRIANELPRERTCVRVFCEKQVPKGEQTFQMYNDTRRDMIYRVKKKYKATTPKKTK